jgi:hypothetical protein
MKNEFPKELFVRKDQNDFLAFPARAQAVDEDGPTEVATYELVETKSLKKVVKED